MTCVDPDNRLVAGELERRWNEALARVAEAEARLATLEGQRHVPLSEEQRQRLLTLGHDLSDGVASSRRPRGAQKTHSAHGAA